MQEATEFRDLSRLTADGSQQQEQLDIQLESKQMYVDIDQDLERTFTDMEFFRRSETQAALRRVLTAFTNYD